MANRDEQIALQQIIPDQPCRAVYQRRQNRFEIKTYLAVLSSNLLSLSCGLALEWTAVLAVNFKNFIEDKVFENSDFKSIHGVLFIAATLIPLYVTFPVTKFGRKVVLIGSAVVLSISFLLCAFAKTALRFYFARVLQGIGVGTAFTVLPMYLSEISSNEMRGLCTGSMVLFVQIGSMIPGCLKGLLSLKSFSLACLIPLIVFLIIFSWWNPESLIFSAFIGKHQQLKHDLRVLQKNVDEETESINQYIKVVEQKVGIRNLFKRGFFLVLLLFVCQALAGEQVFSAYITLELHRTGMRKSYILATKLFYPIFATILVLFTINKLGRKILLMTSTIGSTILLICIGVCLHLHYGYHYFLSPWTLFALQTQYMFFSNLGLVIVPWVILGELIAYPQKPVAFALATSCYFFFNFICIIVFNNFVLYMRPDLVTGIFVITHFVGVLIVSLLIPETKKKSLQDIQLLLDKNGK